MERSLNRSPKDYFFQITGITWKKNYQNLFDYDQHSNETLISFIQQLSIKQSFFLIWRNKKTLEVTIQTKGQLKKINDQQVDKYIQLICAGKTTTKDKNFNLKLYQPDQIFNETQNQNQNSYKRYNEHHIVVRSLKNQEKQPTGYNLKSNSIIKLGNCEFFVHLVHTQNENQFILQPLDLSMKKKKPKTNKSVFDDINFFINSNQKVYDANSENNPSDVQCKYCMMPDSEQDGQFLCSPCKCSGSCGLVHFNCLVKWNQNKVKKTEGKGCVQYNFQKFFCQVCKDQYPQYIKKRSKIHQILPIDKPTNQFIIIEALNSLKRHIIIVENVNNEGLVIGRGQQCELKLDEPTISRRHAQIKKQGNNFKLYDLKSKFGTLVRDFSLGFQLKRNQKFSIQSGRSVISFMLLKRSNDTLFQSP